MISVVPTPKFNAPYPQVFEGATRTVRQAKILVLQDGSVNTIAADLTAEGFDVTSSGATIYYQYTGTDFSAFDAVLWLEGTNFGNPMQAGVDAALAAYVARGGGLVRTGFGMYWSGRAARRGLSIPNPACYAIMPVTYNLPSAIDPPVKTTADVWSVRSSPRSLTRDLPATIPSTGAFSMMNLRPTSTLVASLINAQSVEPVPLLSYTREFGGMTVFHADGLHYPTPARVIEADIKKSLFNACWLACQRYDAPYPNVYDPSTDKFRAARVLVFRDGTTTASAVLISALTAAGFTVTDGGNYYAYVGVDFSAYDTILWLEGQNYGNALQPGVDAAIAAFVAGGGGLVRTEWSMWYSASRLKGGLSVPNPLSLAIMPYEHTADDTYAYPPSFLVTKPGHPLARGLSTSAIATTSGNTTLIPKSHAVIVAAAGGRGVIACTSEYGGRVVHLNDTVASERGAAALTGDLRQMYLNACWYTAQRKA